MDGYHRDEQGGLRIFRNSCQINILGALPVTGSRAGGPAMAKKDDSLFHHPSTSHIRQIVIIVQATV